jgi:O-antigen/teichoic acid export membrane protein
VRRRLASGLAQNAAWMLSGNGLRLAGRMVYFVIVAHVLGPAGYGSFVACTALVAAMSPFASWGTGDVLIKYVARDRNRLPVYLGNALLVTIASGLLLTVFALLIRSRVLPASATFGMLLAVAVADLLGLPVIDTCLHAFAAIGQVRHYSQIVALSTLCRLIAALVLAATAATPLHWAHLYAAGAVIATFAALAAAIRWCGSPRLQLNLLLPSVREGFHFSVSTASQSIYSDIDKTMLARLSTVESAAIYAVACRFIEPIMLPIRSLAMATYPEFFRQGEQGVTSGFAFAKRICRRTFLYGLGASIALFLGAGAVPLIFGRAYAESVVALRWLCLLPLVHSVRTFVSDSLTGANYQWQRSLLDIVMAIFSVFFNLWIIRAYAWRGAAWSSLIINSLLLLLLYLVIRWHLRRERPRQATPAAQPILATDEK